MTARPYVVYDIDGVLADLTYGLTLRAAELWPNIPVIRQESQPSWSFRNALSEDQQREIWREIDESPTFWEGLLPICSPDDITRMRWLTRQGYAAVYLTNRRGTRAEEQTLSWLWRYEFPHGRLILSDDKAYSAAQLVREHPEGWFPAGIIEDAPSNIRTLRQAHMPVWIQDRPYNEGVPGERVRTVGDFVRAIARQGGRDVTTGTEAATRPVRAVAERGAPDGQGLAG